MRAAHSPYVGSISIGFAAFLGIAVPNVPVPWLEHRFRSSPRLVDKFVLSIAKLVFYTYAMLWLLARRDVKVAKIEDVLELFYIDFLRIERDYVEVVKLDRCELVTRCTNPCPILSLSLRLGLDTRYTCREVSEPVCRFILKKLRPDIVFERNYGWIRPYRESCEERIYLANCLQPASLKERLPTGSFQ